MWRDILLVVGVIVTILAWWGVTPKQVARLTREHITSNRLRVSLVVIITASVIYVVFFHRRPIDWGIAAILSYCCFVMWQPIVDYYFPSRRVLRKVMSLVGRFGGLPAFAILFITWNAPVWRKLAPFAVGFMLGIVAGYIKDYIHIRRAIKTESNNKK